MKLKIAATEAEREAARILINQTFFISQPILKEECALISLEYRETVLVGENKELLILCIDNKVVGTAVLEIAPDSAYVSYLTRDPSLPKGYGKDLMDFAENRAKKVYSKNKMRVSTVHHLECNQKRLEDWYTKKLGYRFLLTQSSTPEQQQTWKPNCRNAAFNYFEKNL